MSVRLEYMAATWCSVSYVNELDLAEDLYVDDPHDQMVLVVAADEGTVFTGSRDELLGLVERMRQAIEGA